MSEMRDSLDRVSRLAGRACGTVNLALVRGQLNRRTLGEAADGLDEAARLLRVVAPADPVRSLIG